MSRSLGQLERRARVSGSSRCRKLDGMRGRKIISLALGATIVMAGWFLFARLRRCDVAAERPVWSPDGEWVAASAMKACSIGLVTDYSVFVTLRPKSTASSQRNHAVVFETAGASEPPTLSWISGHDLIVKVNDEGRVVSSKHELGSIRITYKVPTSIWDRLGTVESDHLRAERESEELHTKGKLSKDDLRVGGEISAAVAKERSDFRQWVVANASVDDSPR